MTSQAAVQDDVPVDSSLKTFKNFGIHAPVNSAMAPVTRLAINGATSGRYFEFPQLTASQNDSLFCERDFTQKTIARIEACVGVGIYSIKLTYVDGSESPLFGHRQPNVENPVKVDPATQMPTHCTAVRVQAWGQNYVQALTLLGGANNSEELASVAASKGKGEVQTYLIEPGARLVGIYGYQDNKGDVRGFGFLTAQNS